MERMQFDIYKRQIKEERLNDLVEQNKVKIEEGEKIKTFNHLIEDANRRLKAQINMNELQNQLNDDLTSSSNFYKKYNDNEWNEIYLKRFKAYQENINKKKEENRKYYEEERKKKEEEIINLCPKKKAPIKHILEASQKMYDEAKKRRIKIKEKKENSNNISKVSNKINKKVNNTENNDKNKEGIDYSNNILNKFLMNNIDNNDNSRNNNKHLIKNKSVTNNKINIKQNKKKIIPINNKIKNLKSLDHFIWFSSYKSSKVNNEFIPNKYINSYKSKKVNNKINDSNLQYNHFDNINYNINDNNFNLEEERKFLIKMAEKKKLHQKPKKFQ